MKKLPANGKPSVLPDNEEGENVWATVLVIVYLTVVQAAQKTYWEMVVAKAKKWQAKTLLKLGVKANEVEEAAKKFLLENGYQAQ